MKKIGLIIATAFLFFACSEKSVKMEIANTSSVDYEGEIISVSWPSIIEKLTLAEGKSIIILNEDGAQVPYQLITNGESTPQELIFPVTAAKGQKLIYSIEEGIPEQFTRYTFGRSVPERKDDFAWENDKIAFRMYGPALAPENPSNGVDIWLKRTNDLVLDKFYSDELEKGISYHVDNGLGLDCYKVAHTLGAGGIAPFYNDSLWVAGYYSTAKVLDSGALRTTFVLNYDSIPFDGKTLTSTVTISLDAGSRLSKAIVTYDGDFEETQVAAGIWLHDEIGNMMTNKDAGYIAYGEKAVSDAGLESGRNFIGVLIPSGMTDARQHNTHLAAFANYKKGDQLVYYFGAGWDKWGIESDEAWSKYMEDYSARLKQPLTVTIL